MTHIFRKTALIIVLSALACTRAESNNLRPIVQDFPGNGKVSTLYLVGQKGGAIEYKADLSLLELKATPKTTFAAIGEKTISGNFYAQTEFTTDDAVGLVLMKSKDGKPDPDNFTMITVTTRNGIVYANHYDRQNGVDNVHDPIKPSKIAPSRYQSKLDGTVYSVPYTSTNKKLRIMHESISNTFRFYYGVRLDKWGMVSDDWMELAPLYSWLDNDQEWFVGVVCRNETDKAQKAVYYKSLTTKQLPLTDIDDSNTGFKVRERDYTWSGFTGKATVVTFGEEFAYDKNIKFIFWDWNNNAPMWRIDNQFELSFEFSESGDRMYQGCHEAMSDRQRHGQFVKVIEDNAVRKKILWHGIALNPDYHYVGEEAGGQDKPTFDEYWTFYPDGTALRELVDKPKVDVAGRRKAWGPEFIELMPIGGSIVEAGDLCASPALTLMDMTGRENDFHPPLSSTFNSDTWNWQQIIFNAHFQNNPDFYIVYSQSEKYPDTWAGITLQGQLQWQSPDHKFSHWPVGREPYGQNVSAGLVASQSHSSYANEVTHTSLVSAGFYNKGAEFEDHYKIGADNRPYRSHVMLVGLAKQADNQTIKQNVHTWLFPGTIEMLSEGCKFVGNNYTERYFEFDDQTKSGKCSFSIVTGQYDVLNPAIMIANWGGKPNAEVTVNGQKVKSISAMEKGNLLVWIEAKIDGAAVVTINDSTKYEPKISNNPELKVAM